MLRSTIEYWAKRAAITATHVGSRRGPFKVARNNLLIQHVGDQLFWVAGAHGYPLDNPEALDPFGGTGLLMSHTYAPRCKRVDLWEYHEERAKLAEHLGPNVRAFQGDSIAAMNSGDARLGTYDFIILDNNIGGVYGSDYCEHFECMPAVFRYFKRDIPYAVLAVNFLSDPDAMNADPRFHTETFAQQMERRMAFFATKERKMTPATAAKAYDREARKEGWKVVGHGLVPRHPFLHFLLLFLEPAK
jgi:hypothetical protein